MVCNRAALPASSRRRLRAAARVRAKAGHLEPDLAVRVEVDLAVRAEAEHLEPDLVLRAVLEVVRAQVKAAPVEVLEQDRAEHPVVDALTRSLIPRMARFPTPWLVVRNQTT